MKLYQYKTKVITKLLNYKPQSEREEQLIDLLLTKVRNLRTMTLPNFLLTIHLALSEETSDKFKNLLKSLIPNEEEVNELLEERGNENENRNC